VILAQLRGQRSRTKGHVGQRSRWHQSNDLQPSLKRGEEKDGISLLPPRWVLVSSRSAHVSLGLLFGPSFVRFPHWLPVANSGWLFPGFRVPFPSSLPLNLKTTLRFLKPLQTCCQVSERLVRQGLRDFLSFRHRMACHSHGHHSCRHRSARAGHSRRLLLPAEALQCFQDLKTSFVTAKNRNAA